MAGHSVPIDFWVDPVKVVNPVERETILQDILPILEPYAGVLKKVTDAAIPGGNFVSIFASEDMTLSVKLYKNGLISCTLEYLVAEEAINEHKILIDDGRKIEEELKSKLSSSRAKVLTAIKRGPSINPYYTTSDDRILEYDIEKVLFVEKSPFQKVEIVQTKSYGNILILDDLQNLAESDLSYTQALMHKDKEDFKGKEVLILGGGDGALLWELLKEEPGFVTMIDIDEVVLKACRKYLRSACGDCLDNYKGKNYEIIIGDAIAYMKNYIKEGKKFDYVFADLTDIPISSSPRGQLWDFIREIMNLGIEVLKPSGKYMTHAIGIQCESALKMFEEQMSNLKRTVEFSRSNAFVPSFKENWCFYQITLV
ncbi:Spermine synthase [Armadillidium nasatum]|uniref:Spermine synthase n=1 Tax=Armadillidium nasatum TaxID=96803 RepID=A0A5N5T8R5_9CRUS|nr:Spermine synthase [Armadillidium nasatum]